MPNEQIKPTGSPYPVDISVGDTLWVTWRDPKRGRRTSFVVAKVGRKWVHGTCGYRFAKDSWYIDGGNYSSPGRVWPTKAHAEESAQLSRQWRAFERAVERPYGTPAKLTLAAIHSAAAILGLDMETTDAE